ncbi:contact-dependent growth inhibition system immunity protein [Bacillus sp. JZ8]
MTNQEMKLLRKQFTILNSFLGGVFHQDIESLESAWEEFIDEITKDDMLILIQEIERFLKTELSHQDMEEFIEENSFIYFPEINITPLKWLTQVQDELKRAVDLG